MHGTTVITRPNYTSVADCRYQPLYICWDNNWRNAARVLCNNRAQLLELHGPETDDEECCSADCYEIRRQLALSVESYFSRPVEFVDQLIICNRNSHRRWCTVQGAADTSYRAAARLRWHLLFMFCRRQITIRPIRNRASVIVIISSVFQFSIRYLCSL